MEDIKTASFHNAFSLCVYDRLLDHSEKNTKKAVFSQLFIYRIIYYHFLHSVQKRIMCQKASGVEVNV